MPVHPANATPSVAARLRDAVSRREGLLPLAAGMAVAFLFTWTGMLRFMGWFLRSLFHETGHVVVSWLAGCPAFPAISLQGHAAAFHRPQQAMVCVLVGLLVGYLLLGSLRARRLRGIAVPAAILWALVTFLAGPREIVFLLGGHLGELVFAGVFLRRALTGEAVQHGLERPLYAGLGWYLVGSNVALGGGLAFSTSVRAWYAGSGSFGLENDYLRVASALGTGVGTIGAGMALAALAVPVVALLGSVPRPAAARAAVTPAVRTARDQGPPGGPGGATEPWRRPGGASRLGSVRRG